MSATQGETTEGESSVFSDDGDDRDCGIRRCRSLSLREAVDELTQLRLVSLRRHVSHVTHPKYITVLIDIRLNVY